MSMENPPSSKCLLDELNQQFRSNEPFRIGSGGGPESRFEGLIDEVRAYHRALPADEVAVVANPDAVNQIAAIPVAKRSPARQTRFVAISSLPRRLNQSAKHINR